MRNTIACTLIRSQNIFISCIVRSWAASASARVCVIELVHTVVRGYVVRALMIIVTHCKNRPDSETNQYETKCWKETKNSRIKLKRCCERWIVVFRINWIKYARVFIPFIPRPCVSSLFFFFSFFLLLLFNITQKQSSNEKKKKKGAKHTQNVECYAKRVSYIRIAYTMAEMVFFFLLL